MASVSLCVFSLFIISPYSYSTQKLYWVLRKTLWIYGPHKNAVQTRKLTELF